MGRLVRLPGSWTIRREVWVTEAEYPSIFWGRSHSAIHPPQVPYLQVLATELNAIGDNQTPAIKQIFRDYDLDPATRREREREAARQSAEKEEPPTAQDLYKINKALSMELIASLIMFRLDTPLSSRANCAMRNWWPSCFSPSGVPDVTMVYGGTTVTVEVSAKREMSENYYGKELLSALKHMKSSEALWTLLVTDWDLEYQKARKIYEDFCKQHVKGRRIIPISTKSLAHVCTELAADTRFQSGEKIISSESMLEIFEALGKAIDAGEWNLGKIWVPEARKRMDEIPDPPDPDSFQSPGSGPGGGPGM